MIIKQLQKDVQIVRGEYRNLEILTIIINTFENYKCKDKIDRDFIRDFLRSGCNAIYSNEHAIDDIVFLMDCERSLFCHKPLSSYKYVFRGFTFDSKFGLRYINKPCGERLKDCERGFILWFVETIIERRNIYHDKNLRKYFLHYMVRNCKIGEEFDLENGFAKWAKNGLKGFDIRKLSC